MCKYVHLLIVPTVLNGPQESENRDMSGRIDQILTPSLMTGKPSDKTSYDVLTLKCTL